MRALGSAGTPAVANLNIVLEIDGRAGDGFGVPIADEAGPMCTVRGDGSRIEHVPEHQDGSSDLLAYFHEQVSELLHKRAYAIRRDRGLEGDRRCAYRAVPGDGAVRA
jgi:hypothetical protein